MAYGPFAGRLTRHLEMAPHIGPVTKNLEFLDVEGSLYAQSLRVVEGGGESRLSQRQLAGHHEQVVVGQKAQDGLTIASLRRRHEGVDQFADSGFIIRHGVSGA